MGDLRILLQRSFVGCLEFKQFLTEILTSDSILQHRCQQGQMRTDDYCDVSNTVVTTSVIKPIQQKNILLGILDSEQLDRQSLPRISVQILSLKQATKSHHSYIPNCYV